MECKQTIEDRLVQELQRTIYLKGAFANIASRTNQYSLAAIENELSSGAHFDQEFERLMLQTSTSKGDASDHNRASIVGVPAAPLPTNNVLQTAVSAVKSEWCQSSRLII